MGVSDLITLIGLVIAIITLISERNRDFFLLKFTNSDYALLGSAFCLINYLVFFEYFWQIGIYFDSFMSESGLLPKDWAYVVTLLVVLFLIYKVFFALFPAENKSKVIAYYNSLLFNEEHLNIITLYEKYHKADLLKHLSDNNVRSNNIIYANNIYFEIISRDDFIEKTASLRPYFFNDIVELFKERSFTNEEVISTYLKTLLRNKNQFLFREIKNNQNYGEGGFQYRLPSENKILNSLLTDLDVIENNLVWKPFGECAIEELKFEKQNGFLSLFNKAYDEKDILWSTVTFNSIWFFDIMVRKAIVEQKESHFWLHYYRYFVDLLIELIDINEINEIDQEAEFPTNAHYIIYEVISNTRDWIKYCNENNNDVHSYEASKCLGGCVKAVCESEKLTQKFKSYITEISIGLYFKSYYKRDQNRCNSFMVDSYIQPGLMDPTPEYKSAFLAAWGEFDKVPYQIQGRRELLRSFEQNVINPLQIP
ncbi:MAG: hypothetical protein IPM51_08630 [Sphingobacteriaceae bacterium]|nr:hypothetical protein [Sphingobacteriaceae bacterium]